MANVNLISARRAERIRLTKVTRGLAVGLLLTGAAGFGLIVVMTGSLLFQNAQISAADSELTKLQPIIRAIEAAEAEHAAIQPKLKTLSSAQTSTRRWFGIMDGLKRVVPEQTWLTNVSVEKVGDATATMRLNGVTVNQTRVGETMYRLSLQPNYYKQVDLRFTNTTAASAEKQKSVEFELAAQLNLPGAEQKGDDSATQAN
jgi:Tfp pilus assembly protein PilN